MFQIPAVVTGIPTGWKDRFYGRNGESLGALSIEEQDRIRGQEKKDWSKQLIPDAAMLLLGNEDFDYLFSAPPEASWRLYDWRKSVFE